MASNGLVSRYELCNQILVSHSSTMCVRSNQMLTGEYDLHWWVSLVHSMLQLIQTKQVTKTWAFALSA